MPTEISLNFASKATVNSLRLRRDNRRGRKARDARRFRLSGQLRALAARFSLRTSLLLLLFFVVAILIVDRVRETARLRADAIAQAHAEC